MPASTLRHALLPCIAAIAFAYVTPAAWARGVTAEAPRAEAKKIAQASSQNLYAGEIGEGNGVLLKLTQNAQGLTGSYTHARGWAQNEIAVQGQFKQQRLSLRETLLQQQNGKQASWRGELSQDGSTLSGTWTSADGRSMPFTLQRVASWSTQAVEAKDGVRSCERPRFNDARYERLNRELAETCDLFLADGATPGRMHLEIDSLGQYMVAAVAYAEEAGQEQAPETLSVDLGAAEDAPAELRRPAVTAIAGRP